jgi:hypothetical protein
MKLKVNGVEVSWSPPPFCTRIEVRSSILAVKYSSWCPFPPLVVFLINITADHLLLARRILCSSSRRVWRFSSQTNCTSFKIRYVNKNDWKENLHCIDWSMTNFRKQTCQAFQYLIDSSPPWALFKLGLMGLRVGLCASRRSLEAGNGGGSPSRHPVCLPS